MTDGRLVVREAGVDDLAAVMNVLDAAMLEVDAAAVRRRIPGGVLAATDGDRVLGACVVDPRAEGSERSRREEPDLTPGEEIGGHVVAVAVRPGRRGQGIGTALLAAAGERWGVLTAEFDARVRSFYESVGFDVEPVGGGRFRGRWRNGG